MEFYKRTNHGNKGLISVDRRTRPTLILTIPCFLFKSSTKDLSLPTFGIVIRHTGPVAGRSVAIVWYECIRTRVKSEEVNIAAFQHGFELRGVQL